MGQLCDKATGREVEGRPSLVQMQKPQYGPVVMVGGRQHVGAAHGPPDPPMCDAAKRVLLVAPKVYAPLDPGFAPLVLGERHYLQMLPKSHEKLMWALPRQNGCARGQLGVFPGDHQYFGASTHLAGVLIQEMMWQRSASELILYGPAEVCEAMQQAFSPLGKFAFEVKTMPKVCGTPNLAFKVSVVMDAVELPEGHDKVQVCGKDASGCRLSFDLGKSDIKTVAVKDNEVIESKETEWDVTKPDPEYHYNMILRALRETAKKLPQVDAIGGSATGTVSADNEATWCDIFPKVEPGLYQEKCVPMFKNLAKEFGNPPLKVINDGEVTALAGKLMVGEGNLMGISMGSSEGGGFCDKDGNLLGWINELCYIQLDLNPAAPYDPWTPHSGMSHMYLGQRAATRLVAAGKVPVPPNCQPDHPSMNTMQHEQHAKCLKLIQEAMGSQSETLARQIYETVGVYLGYALAQYSRHYEIENALVLGRVSSGKGGQVMLDKAKEVLEVEFPELSIKFHTPDEHFKRVGQCIAAAALPSLETASSPAEAEA